MNKVLTRGVDKIYPSKEALEKALSSGRKLKIYQGFDPSMPSLHLGNLVGVLKLRQFLELGHEVIFLVGDFTGMIGDPTDKRSARKKLTREEVRSNCESWKKQLSNIVKVGKGGIDFRFNSHWLDKINFKELIDITSHFTVQQLIQRDFFQDRLKDEKPIYLHEFLYPVAQALDSVKMGVDLEVGGSDQTFNMLMGRNLCKSILGKDKFVLTTELLVDKEGRKIGKTTGNAVFLDMEPSDMFGSIMSFPDEVILDGFKLLTTLSLEEIEDIDRDPMSFKKRLAFEVVKLVKGFKSAKSAQKEFEQVFSEGKQPDQMKKVSLPESKLSILDILIETELVSSKSQAKRMAKQGAVRINGDKIKDWRDEVEIKKGDVVQVGKRRFVEVK